MYIKKIVTRVYEEIFCYGNKKIYADIDIDSDEDDKRWRVLQYDADEDEWSGILVEPELYMQMRSIFSTDPKKNIVTKKLISNVFREEWADKEYVFYAENKTSHPGKWEILVFNKETKENKVFFLTEDEYKRAQKNIPAYDERDYEDKDDWEYFCDGLLYQDL